MSSPVVEEVLRFEDLAFGTLASRRAVVRWSDSAGGRVCAGTEMRSYLRGRSWVLAAYGAGQRSPRR